jgi:hypothetical protein
VTIDEIKRLYIFIDRNYELTQASGCTILDHKRYIKILIGRFEGYDLDSVDKMILNLEIDGLSDDTEI